MSEHLRCPACGMFDGDHAYKCAHVPTDPTHPASQESAGEAVALDTGNLSDDTLYWALDRLYERGWLDKHKENDYDPRGTQEWQHTLDLFRAFRATLTAELAESREREGRMREALTGMLEIHGVTQRYADTHIEIPQSWVDSSEIARKALAADKEKK